MLIIVSFVIFISNESTFAFAKKEQDCAKCHTLNAEHAKKILSEMIPDMKVLSVKNSPVSGLWEIGFDSGGKKSVIYIDYSFNHILAANIFSIKTKENLTQKSFSKINKIDLSLFPYENALVLGDKDAKHRIVVFDDPD